MENDEQILSKLPPEFSERMRGQLKGEWEAFIHSYALPPWHGLRVNRLKILPEALRGTLPFPTESVCWCPDGFTFPSGERPAKLLSYRAGLFYIQEPSAMLPVEILNPLPGDRVLDICAAPGGKSVQIAGKLAGQGMLVSNDVSASRSRALVKNLELAGVTNAVVLNEQPKRLAERFNGFFDKILADAPCSGEGMFRRAGIDAAKGWAGNKPEICAALQREILRYAAVMLKPGGKLVYSTCTFSETENEKIIEEFLKEHYSFFLLPVDYKKLGVSQVGEYAVRIWPHKADGEGHFAALIQKAEEPDEYNTTIQRRDSASLAPPETFTTFCAERFIQEAGKNLISGTFTVNGVSLYRVPDNLPDLRGLRFARSGWYMGDISRGRFTPSQALAMGLAIKDARSSAQLTRDEAERYLRGESITPENAPAEQSGKPWVLTGYGGYPLGWARLVAGRLKNHLPAGWVD